MPNICHNRLDVIGPADEADRFVDAISDNDYESIDFTLLRPEPSDVGENWYNWRSENWGTKWINDVEWDANIEDDGVCTLSYTYDSAWAPLNPSFWAEVSTVPEPHVHLVLPRVGYGLRRGYGRHQRGHVRPRSQFRDR